MLSRPISEVIEVVLDNEDRLRSYSFIRQSCDWEVVEPSVVLTRLSGMAARDLLAVAADAFLDGDDETDPDERSMSQRHFHAIQCAVRVLTGQAYGGPDAPCTVAAIRQEANGVAIRAVMSTYSLEKRPHACADCAGCWKGQRGPG